MCTFYALQTTKHFDFCLLRAPAIGRHARTRIVLGEFESHSSCASAVFLLELSFS